MKLLKNEQSTPAEILKAKRNERYALAAIELLEYDEAYGARNEIEGVLYEWISTFKSKRKYRSSMIITFRKVFEFLDEIKVINEETMYGIRDAEQNIKALKIEADCAN